MKSNEEKFSRIANVLIKSGYSDFFHMLTQAIADILDVEYVLIANTYDDPLTATTLSVFSHGEHIDNFSYDLQGSPCETVSDRGFCEYNEAVAHLFPEDILLGDLRVESYTGLPILTSEGQKIGIFAVMSTKSKQLTLSEREILQLAASQVGAEIELSFKQNRIRALTYQDDVTGLPNREGLTHFITGNPEVDCLILLNIRSFKDINDAYGLRTGDVLLTQVGSRLRRKCAHRAFVARYSGDEFVVVPNSSWHISDDVEKESAIAEEILSWLQIPFTLNQEKLQISFTIGVATIEHMCATSTNSKNFSAELLKNASVALRETKLRGAPYTLYSTDMAERLTSRQRLLSKLTRAIQNDQLTLHYQPVIDLSDERIVGAEILCRWHDDEFGQVSPVVFIGLSEERGLMPQLGRWVLNAAAKQLSAWKDAGIELPGPVSVNISTKQLESREFFNQVESLTRQVDPAKLSFELTETSIMLSPQANIDLVDKIAGLGFKWSLDDFGTGYSSLEYLSRLHASSLKIDRSFISKIPGRSHDQTLVKTIIAMAKSLGMETIAEGVETREQAECLREWGCDKAQGYFYARPMPAEELVILLN